MSRIDARLRAEMAAGRHGLIDHRPPFGGAGAWI